LKKTTFLLVGLFLLASHAGAQTHPICESAASDTDGDGYGWENGQSCIVTVSSTEGMCEDRGDFPWGWNPVTLTSCLLGVQTEPSACIDSDGDGFGWNGVATCIVGSSQCEDRGGYPWGWNPVTLSSCRLDEQTGPAEPTQPPLECSDVNGVAALTSLLDSDTGGGFVALEGIVYFAGTTADTGSELSAYNPATGEVNVIGDIFDGPVSSIPADLTILGGKLYLTARDPVTQRDMWVYDPVTAEEPIPLNLFPNDLLEGDTLPGNLIAFDNRIFFTADEFGVGNELMVFDPQTGAVEPVSDINEGSDSSDPKSLTAVLGKLYFSADDGINGRELWAYDPITDTSTMVTDLSSSPGGSDPAQLYVIDDRIYYNTRSGGQTRVYDPRLDTGPALVDYMVDGQATTGQIIDAISDRLILRFDDSSRGGEPWQYIPQTDSTSLIADINPGPEGSRPFGFVELDGEIYFTAEESFGESELWVYDESTMQARRFIDAAQPDLDFPADLTVLDNRLYFVAGPVSGPRDRKQWAYDPRCS